MQRVLSDLTFGSIKSGLEPEITCACPKLHTLERNFFSELKNKNKTKRRNTCIQTQSYTLPALNYHTPLLFLQTKPFSGQFGTSNLLILFFSLFLSLLSLSLTHTRTLLLFLMILSLDKAYAHLDKPRTQLYKGDIAQHMSSRACVA